MTVFPDAHHLASWCGLCPGNEESAGRRLRNRTRQGNRWLRRALAEAAWAASKVKDSYPKAQFRQLAARHGQKRTSVAVDHSLLVIIYRFLFLLFSCFGFRRGDSRSDSYKERKRKESGGKVPHSKESSVNLQLRPPGFSCEEYNSPQRKLNLLDLSGLLP